MVSLESGPSVPLMPGEGAVCWVLMGTPALGCPWSAVSKARRPRDQRWKTDKGAHSEAVYHQLANVHWVSTPCPVRLLQLHPHCRVGPDDSGRSHPLLRSAPSSSYESASLWVWARLKSSVASSRGP